MSFGLIEMFEKYEKVHSVLVKTTNRTCIMQKRETNFVLVFLDTLIFYYRSLLSPLAA